MATVITNLLSAIPIFGPDLVELIYIIEENNYFSINTLNIVNLSLLATIGTVSVHALKKGSKIKINRDNYLSIPYSFIAFLVGLIDGDGYIKVNKTTKGYISINLVIGLSLEDISTLEYIYSVLKIGRISKYKDYKNPYCTLIINRTDLQEILFPLFIYHNIYFLTDNRISQFELAMFIFKNEIKFYDLIPAALSDKNKISTNIPVLYSLPESPDEVINYLSLPFFKNWLVGFTNAEGSFFIKKNKDGCFQLKQKIHLNLFKSFQILFKTERQIYIEKEKYAQFSVSSKRDIQSVIQFFSFSGLHPLVGLKSIQYFIWLENLQKSDRYKSLNYPS